MADPALPLCRSEDIPLIYIGTLLLALDDTRPWLYIASLICLCVFPAISWDGGEIIGQPRSKQSWHRDC